MPPRAFVARTSPERLTRLCGPRCWSSSRRTSESVRLEGGVGVYVNELSCELERVQWADHDRLARAGERVGSAVDRFLAATQNARALIGGNR
jgi:hypothetical protein